MQLSETWNVKDSSAPSTRPTRSPPPKKPTTFPPVCQRDMRVLLGVMDPVSMPPAHEPFMSKGGVDSGEQPRSARRATPCAANTGRKRHPLQVILGDH